ncbi:hypothetical protein CCACVL1_16780 [Corchorus capsularis]|uniref:Uncharacterized protein n=1 Tax=Corchorus capsularis TaxID=210143 RepID=A0A1R3HVR4_COCAP|nr:hypothetical protein CCACVL1_16780 [Corchorus capsularis]
MSSIKLQTLNMGGAAIGEVPSTISVTASQGRPLKHLNHLPIMRPPRTTTLATKKRLHVPISNKSENRGQWAPLNLRARDSPATVALPAVLADNKIDFSPLLVPRIITDLIPTCKA